MFLTAASFNAPRQCEPTRVKPKVTPTSISAIGLKALANKSSGISINGGSTQPVWANSKPASNGKVKG